MTRPPSRRNRKITSPSWQVELLSERSAFLHYRFRRLRVERNGKRAAVREFVFQLEYDYDLEPITPPRRLVRQRGRSLSVEEAEALWSRIQTLEPERFADAYTCPDHVLPADLDPSVGIDGRPIAVSTGEEGPACLTVRDGRQGGLPKRVVIERYREPPLELVHANRRDAPLATLCALIDPGLKASQPFNYRRSDPVHDLVGMFSQLKALDFLNLHQFERRALEALGTLGDPATVPFMTGSLFASDPRVRLQALDALAWIGDESAAAEVELLYYDDDMSVRDRAREVLDLLRGAFTAR